MKHVVLTDETGAPIGTEEIIKAHTGDGMLHKAFSVFVFRNNRDELLIQKRHKKKMLFGGMWANTCCSHPRENENIVDAGQRRLKEECGFTCPLTEICSFTYKANDPKGKGVECEYDTVLIGDVADITLKPDSKEIEEMKWISIMDLLQDIEDHPTDYAPWFPIALSLILPEQS